MIERRRAHGTCDCFMGTQCKINLTLCRPAESPPARPSAQPGMTPDQDRCHCGRAAACSHQAVKKKKENDSNFKKCNE